MPSPFPGMDPYLESEDTWHDFHVRYVPALAAVLIKKLPERYIIKADQDVFIREMSAEDRRLVGRPDTFIVDDRPAPAADGGAAAVVDRAGASVAAAFPAAAIDVERRPFLEIIDRQRRVVVTAVELLSPSNKSPSGDRGGLPRQAAALAVGRHQPGRDRPAAGRPATYRWRGCPLAITTPWSAGRPTGRRSGSGRSGSATRCRRFRCPS